MARKHYWVPPLERVDLDEILRLIRLEKYFVLHAPRQTGKTSTLLALVDLLNSTGEFRCVYVNFEPGQAAREDSALAMQTLLGRLGTRARVTLGDDFVERVAPALLERYGPHGALGELLVQWSEDSPEPLVLLVDEIDSLVGDTLVSVLRQLRSEYDWRPHHFPQSVILCGVRDVRDYRIHTSKGEIVLGGSAFNIKAEALRLGDFTEREVQSLLGHHVAETGQVFTERALATVWNLTRGQPWLVNALAYQCCFRNREGRDRSRVIDAVAVNDAKEALIKARVTHLDHLVDKLSEDRVRRVIEPVLAGTGSRSNLPANDLDYARDLGLVRVDEEVEIANPIYHEVIPRALTYSTQKYMRQRVAWYVDAKGNLDLAELLNAFQVYCRENSEQWMERFLYKEAGPHLLLQAFLQRIVNGGGRLEREYALGLGRTDLLVLWPENGVWNPARIRKHAIECKVVRQGRGLESTLRGGVAQTARFMDQCGAESGHLVVFDRRPDRSWEDRVFRRNERAGGKLVTVWGM